MALAQQYPKQWLFFFFFFFFGGGGGPGKGELLGNNQRRKNEVVGFEEQITKLKVNMEKMLDWKLNNYLIRQVSLVETEKLVLW